jgi:hypothetical protein
VHKHGSNERGRQRRAEGRNRYREDRMSETNGKQPSEHESAAQLAGVLVPAGSGGSEFFDDDFRLREDARLMARLYGMGVLDPVRARKQIARMFDKIDETDEKNNTKAYVQLVKIPWAAARVGLAAKKEERETVNPPTITNNTTIIINGQPADKSRYKELPVDEKLKLLQAEIETQ